MANEDFILIGVDGGATEVKAHQVHCTDCDGGDGFELGTAAASIKYDVVPGFVPVPIDVQLAQHESGAILLSDTEERQGRLWKMGKRPK